MTLEYLTKNNNEIIWNRYYKLICDNEISHNLKVINHAKICLISINKLYGRN